MAAMKKRMAVAGTLGVWIAAIGSAAALTYDLNRPLQLASVAPQLESRSDTASAAVAEPPPEPPVLYIPDVTIFGTVPHRSSVAASPKKATDISQMKCAAWRELDTGSGHVEVCE